MADVAPGYLATLRGQVNKYIYYRTNLTVADPDYIHDSEATGEEGTDTLQGITQASLDAFQAADFWTTGGQVLNYNPITDRYSIQNGEYVL